MASRGQKGIFRKRFPSMDSLSQRIREHPSKRTLSTSIFPAPQKIPRPFSIANLEERLPTFWHTEKTEDGEIMLTKSQIEQMANELIKVRKEQLTEKYTEMCANFVDRHERAMAVTE